VQFTDERQYFVSEDTVCRLLKAHDLITSPAYVVIKAADAFHTRTTRPNEMWQTDFTYFKIIGWGWMYLSTVLDDFSRYIIAWKLCTNMRAEDVRQAGPRPCCLGLRSATVLTSRLLSILAPATSRANRPKARRPTDGATCAAVSSSEPGQDQRWTRP
jgi:hypothetical protein